MWSPIVACVVFIVSPQLPQILAPPDDAIKVQYSTRLFRVVGIDEHQNQVLSAMPGSTFWVTGTLTKVEICENSPSLYIENDRLEFSLTAEDAKSIRELMELETRPASVSDGRVVLLHDSEEFQLSGGFQLGMKASLGFTESGQFVGILCPVDSLAREAKE